MDTERPMKVRLVVIIIVGEEVDEEDSDSRPRWWWSVNEAMDRDGLGVVDNGTVVGLLGLYGSFRLLEAYCQTIGGRGLSVGHFGGEEG